MKRKSDWRGFIVFLLSSYPCITLAQVLPLGYPCEILSVPENVTDSECKETPDCKDHEISRYRTMDGTCNNLQNPLWGSAGSPFTRLTMRHRLYTSGYPPVFKSKDSLSVLPNARTVSLNCHSGSTDQVLTANLSLMVMQFGQFLDHDLTLTPEMNLCSSACPSIEEFDCCDFIGKPEQPKSCLPILVPSPDEFYDVVNASVHCLDFKRSQPFVCNYSEEDVHKREQFNIITSYVDASGVYGSTEKETKELREFKDGLMRTENDTFMPFHERMCEKHEEEIPDAYLAGDMRVNENPGLQSLHTLWLREHNRLAGIVKDRNESLNDEQIFQEARRFLVAEYQNIIFSEFLPIVLGPELMNHYGLTISDDTRSEYLPYLSPNIFNSFAAAAFRFGHTLIAGKFNMMDKNFEVLSETLSDHFFDTELMQSGYYDFIVRGMTMQDAERPDNIITSEVRNLLFKKRGHNFGSDLPARNIQRGRDHELGSYDSYRQTCGLSPLPPTFFSQPPKELAREMWQKLRKVYVKPKDIDLFTGGIGELTVDGGLVGPTFACIIGEQFRRLKLGDRYFFSHGNVHRNLRFCIEDFDMIRKRTLKDVLCDNSDIGNLPPHSFLGITYFSDMVSCDDRNQYEPNPNCLADADDIDNPKVDGSPSNTSEDEAFVVVMAGGYDGWNLLDSVETYSPSGTCQHIIAPLPQPTYGLFMMYTGNKLIACGGRTLSGYGSKSCWRYVPRTETQLDYWVEEELLKLNEQRWYGAITEWTNGRFIVTGGAYSPTTSEIFLPDEYKWVDGPAMEEGKLKHCMISVGERIYILGGYGSTHVSGVDMISYDNIALPDLMSFRNKHSCILLPDNDTVMLVGGSKFSNLYKLSTGETIFGTDSILSRSYGAAVSQNGRILIFGGSTHSTRVEEYNKETGEFSLVGVRTRIGRSRFATALVPSSFFLPFPGGCKA